MKPVAQDNVTTAPSLSKPLLTKSKTFKVNSEATHHVPQNFSVKQKRTSKIKESSRLTQEDQPKSKPVDVYNKISMLFFPVEKKYEKKSPELVNKSLNSQGLKVSHMEISDKIRFISQNALQSSNEYSLKSEALFLQSSKKREELLKRQSSLN